MQSAALAIILCIFSVRAGAATGIEVSAHLDGEALIVEARADLAATAGQAWDVLTDYDRLSDFIPDLLVSRVVARHGQRVVVEQKGRVAFLFFRYDVNMRMEIDEHPPIEIVARALDGSFQEMTGRYLIEPSDRGLKLRYSGRFIPSFGVPRALGIAALKRAVEKQFGAMVNEIERKAEADAPRSCAPPLALPVT